MEYKTFKDFYPFYLGEHSNTVCRALHFIGTFLLLVLLVFSIVTKKYMLILLCPIVGYTFAWIGHFIFEKNRPATFKYPVYSLMGDFLMFWQLLTRQLKF